MDSAQVKTQLRSKVFAILNPSSESTLRQKIFEIAILSLILLNVFAVIAETIETVELQYSTLLWNFEVFSVAVFTVEYFLRLWTCTVLERYQQPILGRLRYVVSFMGLVDLLAVLPFYAPLLIPFDLRFLRAVRIFRVFRLLKLARYSKAVANIASVLRAKKAELGVTVLTVLVFLVIASTVMYDVEHQAQPQNFPNIPSAMWWGVVTLTTVGYGDIYPVTPFGKFIGAVIALLGIGLFALPAGILASGLTEQIHSRHDAHKICPHCGKELDGAP